MRCLANEQIAFALRKAENGASVDEVCRMMGVFERTFHHWKTQFVGLDVPEMRRLQWLIDQSSKLKRLVAGLIRCQRWAALPRLPTHARRRT